MVALGTGWQWGHPGVQMEHATACASTRIPRVLLERLFQRQAEGATADVPFAIAHKSWCTPRAWVLTTAARRGNAISTHAATVERPNTPWAVVRIAAAARTRHTNAASPDVVPGAYGG